MKLKAIDPEELIIGEEYVVGALGENRKENIIKLKLVKRDDLYIYVEHISGPDVFGENTDGLIQFYKMSTLYQIEIDELTQQCVDLLNRNKTKN